MRRGKGLIPGEPAEAPATNTPAEEAKEKVVEAKEGESEEEKTPEAEDKKGKRKNNK